MTFKEKESGRHRLTRGSEKKQPRVGGVEGQAPGHSGWSSRFRVKMQLKSHCAQDQTEAGLRGKALHSPILARSCESCSSPSSSLGIILLHHSSTSLSKCQRGFVGAPRRPHVTPKAPLLQQPAGKKGVFWRLLDCFQNSIKQPCQEGRIFPYFSDKETEAR